MYNINKGKNDSLLDKCRPLAEYMELINRIRKNQGELAKDAVDAAVQSCIKDGILQDFLVKHRAEVVDVCLTEFNEERFVNDITIQTTVENYCDISMPKADIIRKLIDKRGLSEREAEAKFLEYAPEGYTV